VARLWCHCADGEAKGTAQVGVDNGPTVNDDDGEDEKISVRSKGIVQGKGE